MHYLDKKILLIVSGSIAAYKSLDLIRELTKLNCEVKTVLTKNGHKFITPMSITSLSKNKVYTDLFSLENESEMDHISLSRWADLILIAPATTNIMAKMSNGICDDLATTIVQASNKRVFICPAMNVRMWEHSSNKQNIEKLKSFGYKIIGPSKGEMACGEYGEGKMLETNFILKKLETFFKIEKNAKKLKAIVTAGPTQEYIDPIRFISNRSSGKQGYAIANSLINTGIKTTLISGPTNLKPNSELNFIKVKTADEMYKKTIENLPCDIAIFCAAVADFKSYKINDKKIKKENLKNIKFTKNIDILSAISKNNRRPNLVIGFAAETENIFYNSKKKLQEKECDWIIANNVNDEEIGFDSNLNEIFIFYKNKKLDDEKISKTYKSVIADEIVKRIITHLNLD